MKKVISVIISMTNQATLSVDASESKPYDILNTGPDCWSHTNRQTE